MAAEWILCCMFMYYNLPRTMNRYDIAGCVGLVGFMSCMIYALAFLIEVSIPEANFKLIGCNYESIHASPPETADGYFWFSSGDHWRCINPPVRIRLLRIYDPDANANMEEHCGDGSPWHSFFDTFPAAKNGQRIVMAPDYATLKEAFEYFQAHGTNVLIHRESIMKWFWERQSIFY